MRCFKDYYLALKEELKNEDDINLTQKSIEMIEFIIDEIDKDFDFMEYLDGEWKSNG